MAQIYKNIKVNGYDLFQRFGLMSVHVKSNEERMFGLKRSMEIQDGTGNPIFIKVKADRPTFKIELCKTHNGEPTSISEDELEEIGRILFVDKMSLIEAGGDLYYGVFTDAESWFNGARQGYITLTFEMGVPHVYSPVYLTPVRVNGSKIVEVFNKSSVKKVVYLDMEIQQLGENGDVIEIINRTNGTSMKLKNIDKNEVIQVLGEDVREVYSKTNPDKNIYKDMEYTDFMKINYGKNNIEIKGKCKVNVKYQLPKILK